jgi:lipoic acid synthetase
MKTDKNARKPAWLAKKIEYSEERRAVDSILGRLGLHTVCRSARCPNLSECFSARRATFLILGNCCTRSCTFCAIEKARTGESLGVDDREPSRVSEAVTALGLRYAVITSVTRDDLPDGGAGQFVKTVNMIRERDSTVKIEVLTPDFQGSEAAIRAVADSSPDVYNHNVETIPRLYDSVRPGADYNRSLRLLALVRAHRPGVFLKSGLMVGLGEHEDEVASLLADLRSAGCDAVTIGQYLRPGRGNIAVSEYLPQEKFDAYASLARNLGFRYVAAGPYVRSSYMAHEGYRGLSSSG